MTWFIRAQGRDSRVYETRVAKVVDVMPPTRHVLTARHQIHRTTDLSQTGPVLHELCVPHTAYDVHSTQTYNVKVQMKPFVNASNDKNKKE